MLRERLFDACVKYIDCGSGIASQLEASMMLPIQDRKYEFSSSSHKHNSFNDNFLTSVIYLDYEIPGGYCCIILTVISS